MKRFGLLFAAAALAAAGWYASRGTAPAQEKAVPPAGADGDAVAAVKTLAAEYVKAFNAGDAKAVAAFWTENGESTGADGETLFGRAAIEAGLAEQFKAMPRATVEVGVSTVRAVGRNVVVADGTMTARVPGGEEPAETRYSALFVREGDAWKVASVREWEAGPRDVPLADLAWLVGEWAAKGPGGDLKLAYAWDDAKAFLRGTYTLTRDGKAVATGTHVIGKDPLGGLRAWVFDGSGLFAEGGWTKDGTRWLSDSVSTLPDGSDVTAVNVLVPLGPDAFTWQSVSRTAGGTALPDQPPIRATRVGKGK
jgi:uncharacterized protein (TIGR02246 family)